MDDTDRACFYLFIYFLKLKGKIQAVWFKIHPHVLSKLKQPIASLKSFIPLIFNLDFYPFVVPASPTSLIVSLLILLRRT